MFIKQKEKKEREMKDIVKNFEEITERRDTLREEVNEANEAVEKAKNAAAVTEGVGGQTEEVEM